MKTVSESSRHAYFEAERGCVYICMKVQKGEGFLDIYHQDKSRKEGNFTCWAAMAPLVERGFGAGPELALEAESKFIPGQGWERWVDVGAAARLLRVHPDRSSKQTTVLDRGRTGVDLVGVEGKKVLEWVVWCSVDSRRVSRTGSLTAL